MTSRVLIIDDDAAIRESLAEILEFEGVQVLQAVDGLAGIEAARLQQPNLVLCDLMMPQLDGFNVLNMLRSDPITAHIPLVVISAGQEREQALACGAADYLSKPFDIERFLGVIATWLQQGA
jgi:CheY-like chemotaxis protein